MFISWTISGLSNAFISAEWYIVYLPDLSVLAVSFGVCTGYNLWLLWLDYPKVIIFIQSMWQFEKSRFINRTKIKQ